VTCLQSQNWEVQFDQVVRLQSPDFELLLTTPSYPCTHLHMHTHCHIFCVKVEIWFYNSGPCAYSCNQHKRCGLRMHITRKSSKLFRFIILLRNNCFPWCCHGCLSLRQNWENFHRGDFSKSILFLSFCYSQRAA
jgi:hypothetical protein